MVWMKPVSANYKLMSLSELLTLLVHHISLFLMGSGLSIITCLYIFMLIIVCWCLFFMLWPLMYNYFYNVLISSTFPKSYITVNVYIEVTRGHISTTILCVVSNSCGTSVFKEWTSRSVGSVNVNAIKRKQMKHSISINTV